MFLDRSSTPFLAVAGLLVPLALPATASAQGEAPAPQPAGTAADAGKDAAKAQAALTRAMEKNAKKRDYTADLEMKQFIMGMEIKGSGKVQVSSKGMLRQEMKSTVMGNSMTQTIVDDGKVLWIYTESPGAPKMVIRATKAEMEDMKKKMGSMPGSGNEGQDPAAQLESLRAMFDFDTVEESVEYDGGKYWTVSGPMKKDAAKGNNPAMKMMLAVMNRARVFFAKEGDTFSGMEYMDAAGKPVVAMHYKNFNFEPKFEETTFKFEAPAGVQTMSMTEMMRTFGSMAGDDEEDEEDTPPAPASKPAGGK